VAVVADDLVLMAETGTEDSEMEKEYEGEKGLRVNLGKKKVKKCDARFGQNLGKWTCEVYEKGRSSNENK